MEHLRVGDSVLTRTGFSDIFAFMDQVPNEEVEYIQLETESGFELSLTEDHIVYAHEEQVPVLANSIIKGDMLWTAAKPGEDLVPSKVVSVRHNLERGMHAPITQQGSIVVNGVLASSYAKARSLTWSNRTIMHGHDLNRLLHEPLRLACALRASWCGPQWHSGGGRHVWTQFILDTFGWMQVMNEHHSDIRDALVGQPSWYSWLASFMQVCGAMFLLVATDGKVMLGIALTFPLYSLVFPKVVAKLK